MIKKILLAVDRSEFSKRAIENAIEIAKKFDAQILAIHAFEVLDEFTHVTAIAHLPVGIRQSIITDGQDLLKEVKDQIETANITVETMLEEGQAGAVITKNADDKGCDLVVLGSRGFGRVKGFLLGSVSNYVLHHLKCPALIVH